jgi:FkbM family methyltransferase
MSEVKHPPTFGARAARSLRGLNRLAGWRRLVTRLVGHASDMQFRVRNKGAWFEGNMSSFIDRQVYLFGGYEDGDIDAFLRLVPKERRDTLLDIGSNIGTHALRFSGAFREIHCFEPNPTEFGSLERNVALNPKANILLHRLGLADREAVLDFYLTQRDNSGMGTFSTTDQYDVPLMKMDSARVVKADSYIFPKISGKVDAIKIDTQGFEPEVLRGMPRLLRQHRPIIWFELGAATEKQLGTRSTLKQLIPYAFCLFRFEHRRGLLHSTKLVPLQAESLLPGDYVVVPTDDFAPGGPLSNAR